MFWPRTPEEVIAHLDMTQREHVKTCRCDWLEKELAACAGESGQVALILQLALNNLHIMSKTPQI